MTTAIRIGSMEDLLGFVPYTLGYHPADSLVLLVVSAERVEFTARADVTTPPHEIIRRLRRVIARLTADYHIVLIGYGSERPTTEAAAAEITAAGFALSATLWVDGCRFYCLLCDECTPDGTEFDPKYSATAASSVAAGLVARATRDDAVRQIRPIGGIAALAMKQAVDRAEIRFGQIRNNKALIRQGKLAVDEAMSLAKRGEKAGIDEVAWLSIMLIDLHVRDHAWRRTDAEDWQFTFWLDLSRRAEPILAAPIVTILGWCCYRRGDGLLAGEALLRALRIDPGYTLAGLLLTALDEAQPPSWFSPWPPQD